MRRKADGSGRVRGTIGALCFLKLGRALWSNKTKAAASAASAILLAASLAGCSGEEASQGGRAEGAQAATEADAGAALGAEKARRYPTDAAGDEKMEGLSSDDAFASPRSASGGTEGAAEEIREVSLRVYEGFERAVIKFGSQGEVASEIPVWSLSRHDQSGYVRISLPGVTSTATADGDFVGLILDQYYVVRDPEEGGLFVDIFALDEFDYRVTELSDPGRLVVDFRREEGKLELPVVKGETTVVLRPREGETVSSPVTVSSYSRNFEASNTASLIDYDGRVLASRNATANDWIEAWGYFETSLEVPDYEGMATIMVGAENPRDGAFEGIEVPVYLRDG